VQDNHPAASAARELKAAARDALRMGSQWAHTALQWVDDRSQDMNNRNRGPGQYERAQSDRHSTSGHGTGENENDSGYGAERYRSTAHLSGGRQGEHAGGDRDIQSRYASGDRDAQHNQGREGSYPQSMSASAGDYSDRGDYVGFGSSPRSGRSSPSSWVGRENERDMARAGRSNRGYDRGYAGNRDFDDEDFSQSYSQGSSHYGSQGFGAQGSQGVYGPQGLGAQGGIGARDTGYGSGHGTSSGYGASSGGGYSQEGYGSASGWREPGGAGSWRARDVTGQGFGERGYSEQGQAERGSSGRSAGTRSGGYRGLGPKNYTRSDERIRDDLNERLTDSDEIDASGISVDVSNGVATLTGTVEQRWMKHRAEDLAEACGGVRDVNNQIRVTNASQQGSGTMGTSTAQGSGRASASASPGGGAGGLGHSGGGGSTSSSTGGSSTTATSGLSTSAGGTTGSSGSGSTGGGNTNRSSGSSGSTVA
jgi:osmotically-inducible protein OsmY